MEVVVEHRRHPPMKMFFQLTMFFPFRGADNDSYANWWDEMHLLDAEDLLFGHRGVADVPQASEDQLDDDDILDGQLKIDDDDPREQGSIRAVEARYRVHRDAMLHPKFDLLLQHHYRGEQAYIAYLSDVAAAVTIDHCHPQQRIYCGRILLLHSVAAGEIHHTAYYYSDDQKKNGTVVVVAAAGLFFRWFWF